MKVIKGLNNIKDKIKNSVVTIGIFDGVHLGHRKIIRETVRRSKTLRGKSVVLTFDPHPLKVIKSSARIPTLISLDHRIRLIGSLGVDYLVIAVFTKALASLSPEKFVKDILAKRLNAKEIYVSENFYFGKGAKAGVRRLKAIAEGMALTVRIVKPVKIDGTVVSSSIIREMISKGDLGRASRFLGRPVSVFGTVIGGSKFARVLGYPTANINPHHEAIPPSGVYAVRVRFNNRLLNGLLNIGQRPTFYGPRDEEPAIEVHIFGFNKRIYGKDLEVVFVKKMRDELKFKNAGDLIAQIKKDAIRARKILKAV